MSIYDDLRRAMELLDAQPYQPHPPLLSPRCGIHAEHDKCRSVICECDCHLPRPGHGDPGTDTKGPRG